MEHWEAVIVTIAVASGVGLLWSIATRLEEAVKRLEEIEHHTRGIPPVKFPDRP